MMGFSERMDTNLKQTVHNFDDSSHWIKTALALNNGVGEPSSIMDDTSMKIVRLESVKQIGTTQYSVKYVHTL